MILVSKDCYATYNLSQFDALQVASKGSEYYLQLVKYSTNSSTDCSFQKSNNKTVITLLRGSEDLIVSKWEDITDKWASDLMDKYIIEEKNGCAPKG